LLTFVLILLIKGYGLKQKKDMPEFKLSTRPAAKTTLQGDRMHEIVRAHSNL